MNVSRYLAESFLGESIEHKLTPEIRKELESFGFRELNDGSYMLNPSKKMTDVVTVEKEGTGILVRWSVGSKHDYKEITTKEVGPFVKSIISKFGGSKVPGKIQESRIEDFTEEDVAYFNSIGAKKVGNAFVKVIDDLKLTFVYDYFENRHILLTLKSISRDSDSILFNGYSGHIRTKDVEPLLELLKNTMTEFKLVKGKFSKEVSKILK